MECFKCRKTNAQTHIVEQNDVDDWKSEGYSRHPKIGDKVNKCPDCGWKFYLPGEIWSSQ